ncbi:methionine aminotransferase [Chitinophaga alhagiae]|uniref:Methionine aminotransferase n=2 Tax=Chitinophaga alhagiae TaxID=2203219 RepID=A0ABN5LS05_9BACT|nr:methionine aminotransferase [Chitinophaga alhagiae]
MRITSKLPDTGTTIFSVMSALAAQHQAVNLGQGFPDFPMNAALVARVNEAMQQGFNQYAPMQGHMLLREVLAEKAAYLYGSRIDPDTQITITPGGTYGIYTAITTVLHPGDEVIVFQPCYDSYIPNIRVNGAIPVLVDLQFPEYRIDWEAVKRSITSRTRMIMLNTPHNPTGAVLSAEDIEQLRAIVTGTPILILSDEVYEHLIYDNIPHQSMLRYPDLLERSFVTFSFGKLYHCTGWKLGYCVSSPALMQEFRKVHQYNCFSCHTPSQVALASFLQEKDSYLQLSGFMQAKRDYFAQLMGHTRFTPLASHGSYFQCYQYHRISDEGAADFAVRLTKEAGVATVPVSAFYQSGKDHRVLRFCFAKKEETLQKAVEQLMKV